jgi:hypothetical protein
LVELAEVQDPGLVPNAVMAALDLHDQAATEPLAPVLPYLREKDLLLVVDNMTPIEILGFDSNSRRPRIPVPRTLRSGEEACFRP